MSLLGNFTMEAGQQVVSRGPLRSALGQELPAGTEFEVTERMYYGTGLVGSAPVGHPPELLYKLTSSGGDIVYITGRDAYLYVSIIG